jgi:D-threo-aldose 1-dehydrogenase
MDPLEKRELGGTGLRVTCIGLGCSGLGGMYGDIPDEQAYDVVRRALSLGINLFDTAPKYGYGTSERRLGTALSGIPRERYVLCTKVGHLLRPAEGDGYVHSTLFPETEEKPYPDFSYDGIMRSFEESLERLGVDYIDVLHIHDPDRDFEQAVNESYPALAKLRCEGVIKGVSVGMNRWPMLVEFASAGEFDCFLIAGRYSILDQSALEGIAGRHCVPIKAAASQFVLAHPAVTAIIPSTRRPERVQENFDLIGVPIPSDFWEELKVERIIRPDAPVPS